MQGKREADTVHGLIVFQGVLVKPDMLRERGLVTLRLPVRRRLLEDVGRIRVRRRLPFLRRRRCAHLCLGETNTRSHGPLVARTSGNGSGPRFARAPETGLPDVESQRQEASRRSPLRGVLPDHGSSGLTGVPSGAMPGMSAWELEAV